MAILIKIVTLFATIPTLSAGTTVAMFMLYNIMYNMNWIVGEKTS